MHNVEMTNAQPYTENYYDGESANAHQAVTALRRRDVTNELREKIFTRINTRRSQIIEQRRSLPGSTAKQIEN
jgi:hypothetical protein